MNAHLTSRAATTLPVSQITIWNFCRLDSLLAAHANEWSWRPVAQLAQKLKHAIVMDDDQIPSNVATMQSRIEFRIEGTGLSQIATLIYPGESHMYDDAMSVLAPLGVAMLGLSERQSIGYAGPDGTAQTLTILRILSQPEAERRRSAARADAYARIGELEAV